MKGLAIADAPEAKPLIGVMLPGTNALEIFAETVDTVKQFSYLVYISSLDAKSRLKLKTLGVRFTTDLNFFILNATALDAALTFGCLPHPAHNRVLVLTALLQELGIPVLDVQHGLFQWGINFTDDSLEQGFSQATGISIPLKTQADYQVTWAGENAIGYPRYKNLSPSPRQADAPVLIATNTNWHIYSEEDRYTFLRTLKQLFTALPHVPFLWKPHPAEMAPNNTTLHSFLDSIRQSPSDYPNVRLFVQNNFAPLTLTDLVRTCRAGIATVGTSVMDFEMLGKPCAIFNSKAVAALNSRLRRADTFYDFLTLLSWFGQLDQSKPPVTGHLKPFDKEAFVRLVNEAIGKSAERRREGVVDTLSKQLKYSGLVKTLGL